MWKLKQLLKRIKHLWREWQARTRTRKIERHWATRLKDLPHAADGSRLLHIGCGEIEAAGYINLDARPGPHVHIVTQDLFRLEVIPDHAFDLVYMSHVLEHVSHLKVIETASHPQGGRRLEGVRTRFRPHPHALPGHRS